MLDADYYQRIAIARAAARGEEIISHWAEHTDDCRLKAGPEQDCPCGELYCCRTLRWVVSVDTYGNAGAAMVH